jgi:hypothetical protein
VGEQGDRVVSRPIVPLDEANLALWFIRVDPLVIWGTKNCSGTRFDFGY